MKTLLAFIVLVLNVLNGYSQFSCGFDKAHQSLLKTNPLYRKSFAESESKLKTILANKDLLKVQGTVYKIPVVVHVIHLGEAVGTGTNISDAQIQSAITSLTQYYRGILGSSVDAEVEFELAKLSPSCTPTNGIVRVNGSAVTNYSTLGLTLASSGGNESTIKALSQWPANHYYNIWVVGEIENNGGGGGIQGFAYFAGAPASVDGTVVLASSFGYDPGGTLGYSLKGYTNLNMTMAHEIGHALGLYHTFEGQQDVNNDGILECPINTDCTVDGDEVCDTDPQVQSNSDCPLGTNACTGNPNNNIVHNFMDYSSEACKTNFSAGQVARMRATLLAARPSLITSNALTTTAPFTPYTSPVAAAFTPAMTTPGFYASGIVNVLLNQKNYSSGIADQDGGYVNGANTCLNLLQMFRGTNYTITVTVQNSNHEQVGAWIDFNNDGDFLDAGEQLFFINNFPATGSGVHSVAATFTVPGSAVLNTPVRMRIMDDLTTAYGGVTPIASNTNTKYGQAEDYPVYFTSILPIVLADFTGELNDDHAKLQWNTAAELNAKGFEIERSYDGSTFKKVGFVSVADGSGTNPRKYSFIDVDGAKENNYYRLKQTDVDNKFQYSKVVFIKSAKAASVKFTVINNPFASYIDVAMQAAPKGRVDIRLLSIAGQEVFRKFEIVSTSGTFRIDLSNKTLQKGIYFLEITSNGDKSTQKIIKQ